MAITLFVCVYLVLSVLPGAGARLFPDSPSYLRVSFFGGVPRPWTVPLVYVLAGSDPVRVLVQGVVGSLSWLVLVTEAGRAVANRVLRRLVQVWLLAMALSAPVLQWNRAILSESISISLTALLAAASLRLWRRQDSSSLAAFVVVLTLWVFARQPQAFVAPLVLLPLLAAALLRRDLRKGAALGCGLCLILVAWALMVSGRSGSRSIAQVNIAEIVQFRAVSNPAEMHDLYDHGMPHPPGFSGVPPLANRGLPINIDQIGDSSAVPRLLADPDFSRWAASKGQSVISGYLVRHPETAIWPPLSAAPTLFTADPGYVPVSAPSVWLGRVVYGSLRANPSATSGQGVRRSSDPAYFGAMAVLGLVLGLVGLLTPRTGRALLPVWALGALSFAWAAVVWAGSAAELPRLMAPPAVLAHVAFVLLAASGIDACLIRLGKISGNETTQ